MELANKINILEINFIGKSIEKMTTEMTELNKLFYENLHMSKITISIFHSDLLELQKLILPLYLEEIYINVIGLKYKKDENDKKEAEQIINKKIKIPFNCKIKLLCYY